MKSLRAVFAAVACLVTATSCTAQTDEELKSDAVAAMEAWLKGIDDGHYAASWKTASPYFKDAVSQALWEAALQATRAPLGKLQSRELASALLQTQVSGGNEEMPEGKFVLAQFTSSFENLASAMETVTFQLGDDGTWHAFGYFIKPN